MTAITGNEHRLLSEDNCRNPHILRTDAQFLLYQLLEYDTRFSTKWHDWHSAILCVGLLQALERYLQRIVRLLAIDRR
jgi:hypothetical protein